MDSVLHVVRKYTNVPGVRGLSLHEIICGRKRPLARLQHEAPLEAENAVRFFSQMEALNRPVEKLCTKYTARGVKQWTSRESASQVMWWGVGYGPSGLQTCWKDHAWW